MTAKIGATYRLQLHAGFTFDDAAAIADYLAALGVTHVYCSPYLQAAPGSTHGYDVIDHSQVNEELGGEEGFVRFTEALARHRLGQVLDIVPNHMAISSSRNRWWADVLENGPSSRYASYFDVEWHPPEARMRNTVLLPVLGDHYGRVLEAGELRLEREGASFRVRYHDQVWPVGPSTLGPVLTLAAREAGSELLAFLADAFAELPRPTATDRASVRRRHRDQEVLRGQLRRLLEDDPRAAIALDAAVRATNEAPDALDALLEAQNYRLAWWRSAGRDLGYRRFFDINTLIGLRMEDEQVFEDTHHRVLEWANGGVLDGLRVDHPDGLRDPGEYLDRLRNAAPRAWIVVEKILEPGEELPDSWPVAGTTGYDFLNRLTGVFVDPDGEQPLTRFYGELTGEETDYRRVAREKKLFVLREVLGSDVARLADLLVAICERHRRHRDYSRRDLSEGIRQLAAAFPVYRTYVRPEAGEVSTADRRYVLEAVEAAIAERPDVEADLFGFLRDLLLLEIRGPLEDELVARFQQLTGPAMAKGVEDTAFYTYNRFAAGNEVGGDPSRFALEVAEFHRAAAVAQERWPHAMLATATHDTKRGEGVRARLVLLSECPGRWAQAVRRWSERAERHRRGEWPDRNAEYLFWQTLVGAWPLSLERAVAYMEKASREAKTHTSWTSPNPEYDAALRSFVEGVHGDADLLADVEAFVEPLIAPGRVNALAQTLVKLTAPGVPDLYQGTELWSLSLVDPDNRLPVDYDERRRALAEIDRLCPAEILARADEALPKLWVLRQALALRRRRPEAFDERGAYEPLAARGRRSGHVLAYVRGARAAVLVPRLVLGAGGDWADTTIEMRCGSWRNLLGGERLEGGAIELAELWRSFPVALLEEEDRS